MCYNAHKQLASSACPPWHRQGGRRGTHAACHQSSPNEPRRCLSSSRFNRKRELLGSIIYPKIAKPRTVTSTRVIGIAGDRHR